MRVHLLVISSLIALASSTNYGVSRYYSYGPYYNYGNGLSYGNRRRTRIFCRFWSRKFIRLWRSWSLQWLRQWRLPRLQQPRQRWNRLQLCFTQLCSLRSQLPWLRRIWPQIWLWLKLQLPCMVSKKISVQPPHFRSQIFTPAQTSDTQKMVEMYSNVYDVMPGISST